MVEGTGIVNCEFILEATQPSAREPGDGPGGGFLQGGIGSGLGLLNGRDERGEVGLRGRVHGTGSRPG